MDIQPLRPFYFMIVVWGQRFRDYLTQYCIPSLLSPNNIPILENNHHNKFLIATTPADWLALQQHPSIVQLKQFMQPVFVEIPPQPSDRSSCQHMGIGHKRMTEICFNDKAYGIAITPDLMVADGGLNTIQKLARAGKQVVFCAALRFAEEPFFAELAQLGIQPSLQLQTQINLSTRQLVQLCLRSFHSETETYDFESEHFVLMHPVALWRMPNEQGLIIHSLSWCPMLIDYNAITTHDTSALEQWTMDGDYIHKNINDHEHIYACQDSDELMLISWAPLNYHSFKLQTVPTFKYIKWARKIRNTYFLDCKQKNPIFDPLKLKLFQLPVRWHVNNLNAKWLRKEKAIQKIIAAQYAEQQIARYIKAIAIWQYSIKIYKKGRKLCKSGIKFCKKKYASIINYSKKCRRRIIRYLKSCVRIVINLIKHYIKLCKYSTLILLTCLGSRTAKQKVINHIKSFLR